MRESVVFYVADSGEVTPAGCAKWMLSTAPSHFSRPFGRVRVSKAVEYSCESPLRVTDDIKPVVQTPLHPSTHRDRLWKSSDVSHCRGSLLYRQDDGASSVRWTSDWRWVMVGLSLTMAPSTFHATVMDDQPGLTRDRHPLMMPLPVIQIIHIFCGTTSEVSGRDADFKNLDATASRVLALQLRTRHIPVTLSGQHLGTRHIRNLANSDRMPYIPLSYSSYSSLFYFVSNASFPDYSNLYTRTCTMQAQQFLRSRWPWI
jgi:hypothetical protein